MMFNSSDLDIVSDLGRSNTSCECLLPLRARTAVTIRFMVKNVDAYE